MADVLLIQTSSFSVKLRPARPDEANQVAALVEHAYVKYVERMGRRPGPMDDDYEAQIAAGRVTVAESDGEIVGILVLVEEPDCLLVENVAVEPSAQGEGLGRALLAHAEEVARASGLSRLRLYTHSTMTENRALYPRLGYVEVDPPADDEWNRIFFVKQTRRAEPMKSAELSGLPPDLPVPVDDGAVEHLKGMAVPSLELAATSGPAVDIAKQPGTVVLYVFPMMGRPGEALPDDWDKIPGARGCTVQSLAYGRHLKDLAALGLTVFGMSVQSVEELREARDRLLLDQVLLSDRDGQARSALRLPSFEVERRTFLRRLTLIIVDGVIDEALYPVFPPGSDVDAAKDWAGA